MVAGGRCRTGGTFCHVELLASYVHKTRLGPGALRSLGWLGCGPAGAALGLLAQLQGVIICLLDGTELGFVRGSAARSARARAVTAEG